MLRLASAVEVGIRKSLVMLEFFPFGLGVLSGLDSQLIQFGKDKSRTLGELETPSARGRLHRPFDFGTSPVRGGHAVGDGRVEVYGDVEIRRSGLPGHHEAVEASRAEEFVVDTVEERVLPDSGLSLVFTPQVSLIVSHCHTAFDSECPLQSSR